MKKQTKKIRKTQEGEKRKKKRRKSEEEEEEEEEAEEATEAKGPVSLRQKQEAPQQRVHDMQQLRDFATLDRP